MLELDNKVTKISLGAVYIQGKLSKGNRPLNKAFVYSRCTLMTKKLYTI